MPEGILWHEKIPVFDINYSQPTNKTTDDKVLTDASELDLLKMFEFMKEVVNQTNLIAKQKIYHRMSQETNCGSFMELFLFLVTPSIQTKSSISHKKMTVSQFYLMLYDARGLSR